MMVSDSTMAQSGKNKLDCRDRRRVLLKVEQGDRIICVDSITQKKSVNPHICISKSLHVKVS